MWRAGLLMLLSIAGENQPGDPGQTTRRMSLHLTASYGAVDRAGCPRRNPFGSVVQVNGNYRQLKAGYLFPEIGVGRPSAPPTLTPH